MTDRLVVIERLRGLLRYLEESNEQEVDFRWLRVELESLAKSLYRSGGEG